jgi:hypothetical protein
VQARAPTMPGRAEVCISAPDHVAFGLLNSVGTRDRSDFRGSMAGWPARSPIDASPAYSRMPAHGSGPMWIATASSWST